MKKSGPNLVQKLETKLAQTNKFPSSTLAVVQVFILFLSQNLAIRLRSLTYQKIYLNEAFTSGKFNNLSDRGFQEDYYPKSEEIENLFAQNGFEKITLRSIRGFGYEKEDMIYKLKNKAAFKDILNLINQTATDKSIIETCGHAMYVGVKK